MDVLWLWWLGNGLFFVIVIPVVVLLVQRLLRPTVEIGQSAEDLDAHAQRVANGLDATAALLQTRDKVRQLSSGFERYVDSVDRML